ncbi:unnamed protein product [Schistosoma margrebowiei]|uniref:Uncharacterized protein n=1 Tax=Schistosoma margrebowiei TaxID=48269 RepID=A0A183MQ41_9TREM|nr:unnamed protein product [Schistosoma margrebowiei]
MLAAEQQLLETFLWKLFIQQNIPEHRESKESFYDADTSPLTIILEACPLEGLDPFIPVRECNISKLSGSQQDNILLNAHKVVTTPDDQGTDPVNEILSP